jgi:hypothetical protein
MAGGPGPEQSYGVRRIPEVMVLAAASMVVSGCVTVSPGGTALPALHQVPPYAPWVPVLHADPVGPVPPSARAAPRASPGERTAAAPESPLPRPRPEAVAAAAGRVPPAPSTPASAAGAAPPAASRSSVRPAAGRRPRAESAGVRGALPAHGAASGGLAPRGTTSGGTAVWPPSRTTLCGLGTRYGRWSPDSAAARICRQAYGD